MLYMSLRVSVTGLFETFSTAFVGLFKLYKTENRFVLISLEYLTVGLFQVQYRIR